jgi:hypothetical protein
MVYTSLMTKTKQYPKTFAKLYLIHCSLRGEEPQQLFMFEILDEMKKIIDQDPKKYKMAFSEDRPCITIPYKVSKYNDVLPPDGVLEDGTEFILESPVLDAFRVSLLFHDFAQFECESDESRKVLNAWLLKRIEKMINLGWEKYCDQYH